MNNSLPLSCCKNYDDEKLCLIFEIDKIYAEGCFKVLESRVLNDGILLVNVRAGVAIVGVSAIQMIFYLKILIIIIYIFSYSECF